ncbi:MAG: hypothetical protein K9L74_06865 [Candidatus Izimaplasma sp.]|nr:hypothetical protein [Candidatus Izimaplasma bacterium]
MKKFYLVIIIFLFFFLTACQKDSKTEEEICTENPYETVCGKRLEPLSVLDFLNYYKTFLDSYFNNQKENFCENYFDGTNQNLLNKCTNKELDLPEALNEITSLDFESMDVESMDYVFLYKDYNRGLEIKVEFQIEIIYNLTFDDAYKIKKIETSTKPFEFGTEDFLKYYLDNVFLKEFNDSSINTDDVCNQYFSDSSQERCSQFRAQTLASNMKVSTGNIEKLDTHFKTILTFNTPFGDKATLMTEISLEEIDNSYQLNINFLNDKEHISSTDSDIYIQTMISDFNHQSYNDFCATYFSIESSNCLLGPEEFDETMYLELTDITYHEDVIEIHLSKRQKSNSNVISTFSLFGNIYTGEELGHYFVKSYDLKHISNEFTTYFNNVLSQRTNDDFCMTYDVFFNNTLTCETVRDNVRDVYVSSSNMVTQADTLIESHLFLNHDNENGYALTYRIIPGEFLFYDIQLTDVTKLDSLVSYNESVSFFETYLDELYNSELSIDQLKEKYHFTASTRVKRYTDLTIDSIESKRVKDDYIKFEYTLTEDKNTFLKTGYFKISQDSSGNYIIDQKDAIQENYPSGITRSMFYALVNEFDSQYIDENIDDETFCSRFFDGTEERFCLVRRANDDELDYDINVDIKRLDYPYFYVGGTRYNNIGNIIEFFNYKVILRYDLNNELQLSFKRMKESSTSLNDIPEKYIFRFIKDYPDQTIATNTFCQQYFLDTDYCELLRGDDLENDISSIEFVSFNRVDRSLDNFEFEVSLIFHFDNNEISRELYFTPKYIDDMGRFVFSIGFKSPTQK